jgi:MerR family transcriptional regulator, redox-sensitive transcriptional activator SoxR
VIVARSVMAMVVVKVGLMSTPSSDSAGHPLMSIGGLAKRSGKTAATIRYYEQIGLLPAPGRVSGKRMYDTDAVRRLAVISTGQRAGLTLEEIKALLSASPGDPAAIDQLRQMAERKLPEIVSLIERTELVRGWLTSATRCECPDLDQCPLFDDPGLPPHRAGPPAARKASPRAS